MPTVRYKENGEWKRLVSLNVTGNTGSGGVLFESKTMTIGVDNPVIWSLDKLRAFGLVASDATQIDASKFKALRVCVQKTDDQHDKNQIVFSELFLPPFTKSSALDDYCGIRGIHSSSTTTVSATFKSGGLDEAAVGFLSFVDGTGVVLTTSDSLSASGDYYVTIFAKAA